MGIQKEHHQNLCQLTQVYNLEPFALHLSKIIKESLSKAQSKYRQGTILTPNFVIWFVILSTIRRDLSYSAVMDWMMSGFRWLSCILPKKLIADGAMTHARVRVGLTVFKVIFKKITDNFNRLKPDFHDLITVIFDGTTCTMPDSKSNCEKFGKSKSGRGESAYPRLRMLTLLAASSRLILDVAYGSSQGKGSGERSLLKEILTTINQKKLLFLLDAGLYSFLTIWTIKIKQGNFIIKVGKNLTLSAISNGRLPDGSYLAEIKGKIPDIKNSTVQRKKWKKETLIVRVIEYQIPGFRPCRLITSILDPKISALELIMHYHRRWDVEISFDEIKTHQCATLKGQMPTIFRSKKSELVEQELYGMLIAYNLVRDLMYQSANQYDKDPLLLSFLDSLQLVIDIIRFINYINTELKDLQSEYLLYLISQSEIDRPRRNRVNPRVVKIKMSKFKRKNSTHKSEIRDLKKDLEIIVPKAA